MRNMILGHISLAKVQQAEQKNNISNAKSRLLTLATIVCSTHNEHIFEKWNKSKRVNDQ